MSTPSDKPSSPAEGTFYDETLPSYSPSHSPTSATPRLVTHSYSLTHKHGLPWLTLTVQSKATSPDRLPMVIGDQPVEGNVIFDPKDHQKLKSITVKITGRLVSEQNMQFSFVEVSQELWPVSETQSGTYTLPFALRLPQTVEAVSEDNTPKNFALPSPDWARYRRYTVVYSLEVKVKYSSILHASDMLETYVNYIPILRPAPPSVLRQDAYGTNSPIPAPDVDPEGWHSLPPTVFEGKIFNDRTITIKYTLSLAKPLSYTRGSVVPLHLLVECTDTHGLDLASAPSAPVVRLRRTSHINYDAGGANTPGMRGKLSDLKPMPMAAFQDLVDWLNTATWWSTPSDAPNSRALQGEIHLRGGMRPSALLGLYKLSYDVALFEPKISGFDPSNARKDKVLQSIEIEIATVYASGPRPIAYSPPTYEEEKANQPEENRNAVFNRFSKDMFL